VQRFNFNAYLCYTLLVSAFVYPVVVHCVGASGLGDQQLHRQQLFQPQPACVTLEF
jgi:ammonia channel protein AmtB